MYKAASESGTMFAKYDRDLTGRKQIPRHHVQIKLLWNKYIFMKTLLQVLICALTLPCLTSCGKTTTINTNMELTGKWKLESIVQEKDTVRRPAPAKGQMDVSLIFKDKGELEATSSTNFLTGFYETAQQNTIQLGGGGTERAETSWGNLFVNALPSVNMYDLKPNKLVLFYDNSNQLIFSRIQ